MTRQNRQKHRDPVREAERMAQIVSGQKQGLKMVYGLIWRYPRCSPSTTVCCLD
jgi:hypothetical protein